MSFMEKNVALQIRVGDVMQNEIVAENPFQYIKVRSLVGWSLLGLIPAVIVSVIISSLTPMDPSFGIIAASAILTVWPLFWIQRKFSAHQINMQQFIGALPQEKQ
jgi:hypothetical protein